ncbi:type I-C CRISPR-associated protein Cas5c [uncultured Thiodictyon sp.]|uniref:type I-C CRISPR-associated protein Cas5c n=1 Tax=uncultured Thiodictyon sp. TaxID=1846217 RepID=UPI0025E2C8F5|nr:type I-C CRISPR-associated protein Cas5c [uncultured Thiodictyon sp.]
MANGTHTIEVWGDFACFTRPEMKVERFSYPVITPSAARGIFDAIYWDARRTGNQIRPYFHWQITRIAVLKIPRYIALRRNEVKEVASATKIRDFLGGKPDSDPIIWADAGEDFFLKPGAKKGDQTRGRTQRQTMALKDVHYRISARIVPKPGFRSDQNSMNSQFQRRASAGKCFQQPYFGCREFPAFFEYLEDSETGILPPIPIDQHLGLMLYDVFDLSLEIVKDGDPPYISLFDATLRGGVIDVPPFDSPTVQKSREM